MFARPVNRALFLLKTIEKLREENIHLRKIITELEARHSQELEAEIKTHRVFIKYLLDIQNDLRNQ
jgi:hypothetical protein